MSHDRTDLASGFGAGQLLVAIVFGEVVSQYPLAGGIYPWCRRLWGRRYAWIVSWLLLVALAINFSGTHVLARVAKIGLAAELIGVVALGLYLLLFQR